MVGLRRLDAFAKTRPDVLNKNATGGIITLVASSAAALLLLAQIFSYIFGSQVTQSLHLAKSYSYPLLRLQDAINPRSHRGRIALSMHVTFPHLACNQIDVTLDGASYNSGEMVRIHGEHTLKLRQPIGADRFANRPAIRYDANSCTVVGTVWPPAVAGVLTIGVSREAWIRAVREVQFHVAGSPDKMHERMQPFNVSHYIHHVQFGQYQAPGLHRPLDKRKNFIHNEFGGIAVEHMQVKLVPTYLPSLGGGRQTYQMSVSEHTIQPATLITKGVQYMPGMVMQYDFTPLLVRQTSDRDHILVFLSSLISIVGGAFVTVGLLAGCLVYSAKEVAKKID